MYTYIHTFQYVHVCMCMPICVQIYTPVNQDIDAYVYKCISLAFYSSWHTSSTFSSSTLLCTWLSVSPACVCSHRGLERNVRRIDISAYISKKYSKLSSTLSPRHSHKGINTCDKHGAPPAALPADSRHICTPTTPLSSNSPIKDSSLLPRTRHSHDFMLDLQSWPQQYFILGI